MDWIYVVSSVAVAALGIMAMLVGSSHEHDCHYRREALVLLGIYLLVAGLMRLYGTSREATGILSIFFCFSLSSTTVCHFLFHRFLEQRGYYADEKRERRLAG
ncbi:MAG: hypothetical protein A3E01_15150 [Gammaproteobacteria bacterium RIFCSPHIGHO2_12_FULL_63_22]|nr:MAG: hypothetical protein A3E01_15150 [Gammaproteobacteria bacterium RIFCSPHIGHO2_12_FULL_63_22]